MPKLDGGSRRLIDIASRPISRRSVLGKSLAATTAGAIAWFLPGGLGETSRVEAVSCCGKFTTIVATNSYCGAGPTGPNCCQQVGRQTAVHLCVTVLFDLFLCFACCWGSCAPCDDRVVGSFSPC